MTDSTLTLCRGNLPPKSRDAAGRALAARFSGWTRTSGEGAWVAPDGTLIVEPMDIWEVATPVPEVFSALIVRLGRDAGEHSVYLVIDGVPSLIATGA